MISLVYLHVLNTGRLPVKYLHGSYIRVTYIELSIIRAV